MVNYQGIDELEVLEGADNYNRWISEKIKPHVVSPALEFGAGTGNISAYFTSVKDLTLTDIDDGLVQKLRERFKGKKNITAEVFNIEKPMTKPKSQFKTIFSVNVLEHIKDDEMAFHNIGKLLMPKGKLIALIPAKQFAYTKLDKKLGHHRRYEKKDLVKKMEKAGLHIESLEYFNVLGLLSWVAREKISRGASLSPMQVKLFDSIVPILKRIEPKKRLPFGISLIVVATKK